MITDARRLLITGAAGSLGTMLRQRLTGDGWGLRLLDIQPVDGPDGVEVITASITEPDGLAGACDGVHAVIHLAGHAGEAPFEDILATNVVGTANVLHAAQQAGCTRVLIASSNHAVGFHTRADAPPGGLPATVPARPDTYDGWSKAANEALGSLYADRFGMDVLAVRIGTCTPAPIDARSLATWLSPDDLARLVRAWLDHPAAGHRAVWGISRNTRRWWSLTEGEALGYLPTDNAERFASLVLADHGGPDLREPVHNRVGGRFTLTDLGHRPLS